MSSCQESSSKNNLELLDLIWNSMTNSKSVNGGNAKVY